ncbi:MAG: hypothetical protein IPO08_05805 [Xanthomonadales bacterium]|nr:hypothetical protein [Xanthomonadales bacterium]
MTRYLTESNLMAALRRGAPVEQLLGVRLDEGDCVLSWIEIDTDRQGRYVVSERQVFDDEIEGLCDVREYEPFDPDHPYGRCREFDAAQDALEHAVSLGASLHRFVNSGLISEEYRDLRDSLRAEGKG